MPRTSQPAAQSGGAILRWDGVSDYEPAALKTDTSQARLFVGPTDPAVVDGVVLAAYDTWRQTAS